MAAAATSDMLMMGEHCSARAGRKNRKVFHGFLPEIMIEILCRLPVEDILRCECVCKDWYNLIHHNKQDPIFATKHLLHQQHQQVLELTSNKFDFIQFHRSNLKGRGECGRPQYFQFLHYHYQRDEHHHHQHGGGDDLVSVTCKLTWLETHETGTRPYRPGPRQLRIMDGDDNYYHILGSCNGLVCVGLNGRCAFICNPAMSEYFNLPDYLDNYDFCEKYRYENPSPTAYDDPYMACGFGYDSRNDEYKVVRIICSSLTRADQHGEAEVYTLGGGGIWRKKGGVSLHLDKLPGVLHNGTLYWISNHDNKILSFDLSSEEFGTFSVPLYNKFLSIQSSLSVFCGCLSVIRTGGEIGDGTEMQVWTMKDISSRGGEEGGSCWIKKFTLAWESDYLWINSKVGRPCALTSDGKLLLWGRSLESLACYDPETRRFDLPSSRDREQIDSTWFGSFPHINSFISLKDIGEEDARVLGVTKKYKICRHVVANQ